MISFKPYLLLGLVLTLSMSGRMQAQYSTTGKPAGQGNPLCPFAFCADPTAIEYEGRLYVYGTNDQQSFDKRGNGTEINYGDINTLVVLSTDDMTNWTYHGTIDMKKVCNSWLYASWAPSIVSRTEDDGKTHFYMYFSNGGSVGVVTATSPLGPWEDPLGKALIDYRTEGLGVCTTPFDPGVCIDTAGVAWLSFGGGSVNSEGTPLMPGNARIVRLGGDMLSFDSPILPIPAPYQFEASELNFIGGKYVYTFNTTWSAGENWSEYGSTQAAPSACSMCYMTTTDPTGEKDTWHYRGEYFANPGKFGLGYGNNHTHLQQFNGKYYLFYHTQDLQNTLGYSGGYRSIAVNEASVKEWNAKISPVTGNRNGVAQLKYMDPYVCQQAETMSTGAGIYATAVGETGNTTLIRIDDGDWTMVKGVDFGEKGSDRCKIKVRGTGRLEIRTGSLTAPIVGSVDFSTQIAVYEEVEMPLNSTLTGVNDLYFVFRGSGWNFDEWQFFPATADGIENLRVVTPEGPDSRCYDLFGNPANENAQGIYIRGKRKHIMTR